MAFVLTILAVLALLLVAEAWWRQHSLHGEFSRKFIHITVGSFVAFWPFFLSWQQIVFLSLAFLLVVIFSKYFSIFKSIHSVSRPTCGEVFFALAVGAVALLTHDRYIYAAALLQMGLADGLAAVAGTRFGRRYQYQIFGHTKSLTGSLTFFITSITILLVIAAASPVFAVSALLIGVAAAATLLENMGGKGLDNLLVPLAVTLLLKMMS